jgi:POT family proton-dependent oligopeptide transporter
MPASPAPAPPSARSAATFLGHPRGLFLLFLVEMWERFSYYGMRGLLVLYLITVFAARELPPGVYHNTLRVEEIAQVAGREVRSHQAIDLALAVGPVQATPAAPAPVGQPALRLTRLRPVADPAGRLIWQVPSEPTAGGVIMAGPPGGPFTCPDDAWSVGHPSDSDHVAFRISNPTEQPIRCEISIHRPAADSRTFFTLNDEPDLIAVTLRPDSQLKEGERPLDVVLKLNDYQSGRNWIKADAGTLYGWYTGLAYLFPILGGIVADRLIGTHRSMLAGALLITLGHITLGISGSGALAHNAAGMSLFVLGLAVIVVGTGYFKPNVSVMVGQLYAADDPRRDGAFTIFYMGINLGAFICAFICGTLGEQVGWHWGFGSAAVGMLLGLLLYLLGRPRYLAGIGEAPRADANRNTLLIFTASLVVAALFALAYHVGVMGSIKAALGWLQERPMAGWGVVAVLLAGILGWLVWFIAANTPEDRGPVVTIFMFIFFNAFFWLAFEQAGSSFNVFTKENTDRSISLPAWLTSYARSGSLAPSLLLMALGAVGLVLSLRSIVRCDARGQAKAATAWLLGAVVAAGVLVVGILAPLGYMQWLADFREIPATWFQSINAGMIFIFAPIFAGVWLALTRRGLNPNQSVKIALGLILLGVGYLFMVAAGRITIGNVAKASMFYMAMTYFIHTLAELCVSPTGLSYVTRVAPVRFVSLLMGIWFISNFIANLGGGLIAAQVKAIEKGEIKLPWNLGGQADFFFLFVVFTIVPGLVILACTPLIKRLQQGRA